MYSRGEGLGHAEDDLGCVIVGDRSQGTVYADGCYDERMTVRGRDGRLYDLWVYADGDYRAYPVE